MRSGQGKTFFWTCAAGWLLASAFLFFPCSLRADVYWLWPSGGRDSGESASAALEKMLNPKPFWKEKIQVNGTDLELRISLVECPLTEIAELLRAERKSNVSLMAGANSILLQEARPGGSLLRRYFLQLSGVHPALLFEMALPPDMKTMDPAAWPADLPLIAGAEDLTLMKFPARSALFGAYTVRNASVPQTLDDLTVRIGALGWERVSRESDHVFEGTGEVFLKEKPSALLILGLRQENGRKAVRVSLYTRPL